MIIPTNGPDKTSGIQIQGLRKVNGVSTISPAGRQDSVNISRLSALVDQARAAAMSLPEIRQDVVERARQSFLQGNKPESTDIASAMINKASEGQV